MEAKDINEVDMDSAALSDDEMDKASGGFDPIKREVYFYICKDCKNYTGFYTIKDYRFECFCGKQMEVVTENPAHEGYNRIDPPKCSLVG